MKYIGLCYRCEYRAESIEDNTSPRAECGNTTSIMSCYMYKPIRPCILKSNKGDTRGQLAPAMIRARQHAVKIADKEIELTAVKTNKGIMLYWTPKLNYEKD